MTQKQLSTYDACMIELALRKLLESKFLEPGGQECATTLLDKIERAKWIVLKTAAEQTDHPQNASPGWFRGTIEKDGFSWRE